ncbi:hypothetical protein PTSG_07709 [Salpingoeca rosetta]|uniref:Uncharacterized protein n=1 Tax=Salpingoeca rosetta (strain ATCC 50818 / BSB-021) TaxID=946362 RepID=F2UHJ3_SALR5|nr:uncharacterized protein PTSG_07709 [Salpingoeca rosetta]EGD76592.1 hypothetical protein PTSG_07709 [Salpingoeca rosetta]|eukprot:XP_004991506.1 hypothetical protein PTSG_07709 [Salpingoeca rosetta]
MSTAFDANHSQILYKQQLGEDDESAESQPASQPARQPVMSDEPVVVEIPVLQKQHHEEDAIQLGPSDLENLDTVIDIITFENVHLKYWAQIADYYRRNAKWDELYTLLDRARQQKAPPNDAEHMPQKIRLMVMLANLLLERAKGARTKAEADQLIDQATQLTNEVDIYDQNNEGNWVCKGYISLFVGTSEHLDRARTLFDLVLTSKSQTSIPALLGRAAIDFHKDLYADALRRYRTVLRISPSCPASIRVAMGMCFARLERFDKARAAFERALALDENNVPALVGTAILLINQKERGAMREAVERLTKAYKLDRTNPMTLNLLGNHFFHRKEYSKALGLVTHVAGTALDRDIKAEAFHHMARIHHQQGNLDTALSHYYQATSLSPSLLPAHYGLGQMYIHKKQLRRARDCFEIVYKHMPTNMAAAKILACMYVQEAETSRSATALEKATALFDKVLKQRPEDIEAWVELGMLLIRSNPKRALGVFGEAKTRLEALGSALPPELVNNMACLHLLNTNHRHAKAMFEEALSGLDLDPDEQADMEEADIEFFKGAKVTVRYNRARLLETTYELDAAEEEYHAILQSHPDYADARFRLGVMAQRRGAINEATIFFKDCLRLNEVTALTLLGNLCIQKRQLQHAQRYFDKIIKLRKKEGDLYSLVSLGNIFFQRVDFVRAQKYFTKALEASVENVFAVNGLGCVFAAQGNTAQAKDLFQQIREATTDVEGMDQILLNLAHAYVDLGSLSEGIALYEYCQRKMGRRTDASIHAALARAHYKNRDYKLARKHFVKAKHLDPLDSRHDFNIALTQQQEARSILDSRRPLPDQLLEAETLLGLARQCFRQLKRPRHQVKYDFKRAEKEERLCVDLRHQSKQRSTAAESEASKLKKQAEVARLFQQQLQQREAEKEERLQRLAEAEARKREKIMEYEQSMPNVGDIMERAEAKKREGRKRRSDADDIINDEEEEPAPLPEEDEGEYDDNDDADDGARKSAKRQASKRKPRSKKSKVVSRREDDDDEDDDDDDDDDDDIARLRAQRSQKLSKKRVVKSKASLDSDSESDDDDDAAKQAAMPRSKVGIRSTKSAEIVESSSEDDDDDDAELKMS